MRVLSPEQNAAIEEVSFCQCNVSQSWFDDGETRSRSSRVFPEVKRVWIHVELRGWDDDLGGAQAQDDFLAALYTIKFPKPREVRVKVTTSIDDSSVLYSEMNSEDWRAWEARIKNRIMQTAEKGERGLETGAAEK